MGDRIKRRSLCFLFLLKLRLPNGCLTSPNNAKLARLSGLCRQTASRYLKVLLKEGLAHYDSKGTLYLHSTSGFVLKGGKRRYSKRSNFWFHQGMDLSSVETIERYLMMYAMAFVQYRKDGLRQAVDDRRNKAPRHKKQKDERHRRASLPETYSDSGISYNYYMKLFGCSTATVKGLWGNAKFCKIIEDVVTFPLEMFSVGGSVEAAREAGHNVFGLGHYIFRRKANHYILPKGAGAPSGNGRFAPLPSTGFSPERQGRRAATLGKPYKGDGEGYPSPCLPFGERGKLRSPSPFGGRRPFGASTVKAGNVKVENVGVATSEAFNVEVSTSTVSTSEAFRKEPPVA